MTLSLTVSSTLDIKKYDGTNERLNAMLDGESVFIVNGNVGRYPVIADTEEQAIERYKELQTQHAFKLATTLNYGEQ